MYNKKDMYKIPNMLISEAIEKGLIPYFDNQRPTECIHCHNELKTIDDLKAGALCFKCDWEYNYD